MAGGTALNIFKLSASGVPKAALNRRLWFAVFTFGLLGAARGVDEGLITGIFNTDTFKQHLGLDKLDEVALAGVKGNVSSMVQLGSIPGALGYDICPFLLLRLLRPLTYITTGLSLFVTVGVVSGLLVNCASSG